MALTWTLVLTLLVAVTSVLSQNDIKLSHNDAEKRVRAAGISVSSSGRCTNRENDACTSLDQVREITVQGVIELQRAVFSCPLVITGGTEVGHAGRSRLSHYQGFKLDLKLNRCLNNFVNDSKNGFTDAGKRSGDNARVYRSPAGNSYAIEKDHWDVTFLYPTI